MLTATHIVVFSEEIVFCDVGAQQGVAHQVDKAQTQALESRYGAGKEQVGSQTAEPRPSPSDLQLRKGVCQGVATAACAGTRIPVPGAVSQKDSSLLGYLQAPVTGEGRRGQCVEPLALRVLLSSELPRLLSQWKG